MKRFLQTILKFLIVPFAILVILIVCYFIFDPYKMFRPYETYTHSLANRDLAGIETLKHKYPKNKYDSFLFGSSRTLAFKPRSWSKHLSKDSSPIALDAFIEVFYGIYHKIKYLDSLNIDINNAIIIVDPDLTFVTDYPNRESPNFYKYPDIDGSSWFAFHRDYLLSYLQPNVAVSFYLNYFFGLKNKYIYQHIGDIKASMDSENNSLGLDDKEEEIKNNPEEYYNKMYFPERGDTLIIRSSSITERQKDWLKEVKSIFDKHKTNFKIVISPLYTQTVLSKSDLDILIDIFGADRVYNFSGINEFTKYKKNYYEMYHYRPLVGDSILNFIYKYQGTQEFK